MNFFLAAAAGSALTQHARYQHKADGVDSSIGLRRERGAAKAKLLALLRPRSVDDRDLRPLARGRMRGGNSVHLDLRSVSFCLSKVILHL